MLPVDDDEALQNAHPLVATRGLLTGTARSLPGAAGQRRPTGSMGRHSLGAAMAIAEALFSVDGHGPDPERMAYLRREFADFVSRATVQGRWLFSLAALLVTILAPPMIGKLPGLGRLPIVERVRALERFESLPTAPILIALRAILCLIYYEHPDAAREVGIGVDGPAGRAPGEGAAP